MSRISDFAFLKQREQPVLCIRTTTTFKELPELIGKSYKKIGEYLKELNDLMTDVPYVTFLNFQHMTEQDMEVEIGFPVSRIYPEKDDIKSGTIPESKIVYCMYRGAYSQLEPVYEEMVGWIKEEGYDVSVSYEYYYNGPGFPESEMLTKIVMPVKHEMIYDAGD